MRKLLYIISIAAMILVAGACNKQDQPDDGSGKMSDLQYLIDGLVRTDDAGNITGYIVGDSLNEANPWEISVPVGNYEEAAAIFRELLPAEAQVTASGKTLTWTMTDEEGKPEATAEFAEDPGLDAHRSEGYDAHALCSMRALRRTYKAIWDNYDRVGDYIERYWPSLDRWYWSGNTSWLRDGFLNMKTGEEKW